MHRNQRGITASFLSDGDIELSQGRGQSRPPTPQSQWHRITELLLGGNPTDDQLLNDSIRRKTGNHNTHGIAAAEGRPRGFPRADNPMSHLISIGLRIQVRVKQPLYAQRDIPVRVDVSPESRGRHMPEVATADQGPDSLSSRASPLRKAWGI